MKTQCDCGKVVRYNDDLAGKVARCPACRGKLVLPLPVADHDQGDEQPQATKLPVGLLVAGGIGAGLLFMFVACAGLVLVMPKNGSAQGQAVENATPTVEASTLLAAYSDNEARAERTYGNGRLRVRGTVTGFLGNTALLEDGPAVSCFGLSRGDVAKLDKGRGCVIEGRVSLGNSGGVHLSNCKVVKTEDTAR